MSVAKGERTPRFPIPTSMRIFNSTDLLVAGIAATAISLATVACHCPEDEAQTSVASASSVVPRTPPQLEVDANGEPVGLEHHRMWSDKIGQSGEPIGEQAFENIAALGYRTVISVDGAAPDVETASRYGLRYVHVPIGYDAILREAQLQIIKAVRESDGPVLFHCHHGLHRGPAATMVARITCDGISNTDAVQGMKESGTSEKYHGLYRDIGAFQAPTAEELARAPALQSRVVPTGTRGAMSFIDRRWDGINASKTSLWSVPASMPDIDPAHEIGMVENSWRDLIQREERKSEPDARFLVLLKEAHAATVELEDAVGAKDTARADAAHAKLKSSCETCHAEYRN